eukprot:2672603-Prymnesium_polylepis.1
MCIRDRRGRARCGVGTHGAAWARTGRARCGVGTHGAAWAARRERTLRASSSSMASAMPSQSWSPLPARVV